MSRRFITAVLAAAALLPASAQAARPHGHPHGFPMNRNGQSAKPMATAAGVYSSSINDLSAFGACDSYNHTNSFSANVMLNPTRFPRGAWISYRYGFRRIGTTNWRMTGWTKWFFITNVVNNPDPDVSITRPYMLPSVSFNITSGRFIAGAQVAVYNGSGYEITSTGADSYNNVGRFGVNLGNASSCWLTV